MKIGRVLGVLGVTAVASLALASAASATTLCESAEYECPPGFRYTIPTKIQAELVAGTSFTVQYGAATTKCNESFFAGETTKNEGAGMQLKLEVGAMWISNNGGGCLLNGKTKCVASKWEGLTYKEAAIYPLTVGSGTLKVENNLAKLRLLCGGVECVYRTPTLEFELKGGLAKAAKLDLNSAEMEKVAPSNMFCAETAVVDAEHLIIAPATALFVSSEP